MFNQPKALVKGNVISVIKRADLEKQALGLAAGLVTRQPLGRRYLPGLWHLAGAAESGWFAPSSRQNGEPRPGQAGRSQSCILPRRGERCFMRLGPDGFSASCVIWDTAEGSLSSGINRFCLPICCYLQSSVTQKFTERAAVSLSFKSLSDGFRGARSSLSKCAQTAEIL